MLVSYPSSVIDYLPTACRLKSLKQNNTGSQCCYTSLPFVDEEWDTPIVGIVKGKRDSCLRYPGADPLRDHATRGQCRSLPIQSRLYPSAGHFYRLSCICRKWNRSDCISGLDIVGRRGYDNGIDDGIDQRLHVEPNHTYRT